MCLDRALADNDCRISVKAHFQIINLEFSKRRIVRFVSFYIFLFVDDPSIESDHGEVVRLDLLWK